MDTHTLPNTSVCHGSTSNTRSYARTSTLMSLSSGTKPEPVDLGETPADARICPTIAYSPHHPARSFKATNIDSHISQLPAEVLGLIFYIAYQDDSFSPPLSLDQLSSPPPICIPIALRLLRVSRTWYTVAVNFPLLWTMVKISSDWSLPSVQAYLSRSKLLPIELNLTASTGNFTPADIGLAEISLRALFGVLVPHVPRCRVISVCVDKSFWPLLALQSWFRDLHAPNLETFTLIADPDEHKPYPDVRPIFTGGTPRLTSLRVNCNAFLLCGALAKNVISLHLKTGSWLFYEQLFHRLPEFSALRDLSLYGEIVEDMVSYLGPISIPSLYSLRLYGSMSLASDILTWISAPLLDNIVLATDDWDDFEDLDDAQGPPKYAFLKRLILSLDDSMVATLAVASRCFPNLEHLTLVGCQLNKVIQCLSDTNGSDGIPWSSLQTLALRDISSQDTEDILCDIVTGRQDAGVPLCRLCLDTTSLLRMTRVEWLKSQVEIVELDEYAGILEQSNPFPPDLYSHRRRYKHFIEPSTT